MMTSDAAEAVARRVLFREARLLDTGAWDEWCAMFEPDAVFWVPAWIDEYETTRDPAREVSLIYHDRRRGLEERIARIESRKSITALPLPRTVHTIGNVEVLAAQPNAIDTAAAVAVHVYDPRTASGQTRHARYAHRLVRRGDDWAIARKTIVICNDRVSSVLDFYSI